MYVCVILVCVYINIYIYINKFFIYIQIYIYIYTYIYIYMYVYMYTYIYINISKISSVISSPESHAKLNHPSDLPSDALESFPATGVRKAQSLAKPNPMVPASPAKLRILSAGSGCGSYRVWMLDERVIPAISPTKELACACRNFGLRVFFLAKFSWARITWSVRGVNLRANWRAEWTHVIWINSNPFSRQDVPKNMFFKQPPAAIMVYTNYGNRPSMIKTHAKQTASVGWPSVSPQWCHFNLFPIHFSCMANHVISCKNNVAIEIAHLMWWFTNSTWWFSQMFHGFLKVNWVNHPKKYRGNNTEATSS